MIKLHYPKTRASDDVGAAAGLKFPDPYQWLQANDEAVEKWQLAQNDLTDRYLQQWPHHEALRKAVGHYFVDRINTVPRFVAGCWFRIEQARDLLPPYVVISRAPYGADRRLPVLSAQDSNKPLFVSWISPSPDGRIVAIGVCYDGSENNTIRLLDADSGGPLMMPPPQLLMDDWTGGVCWLPDCSGFYFLALEGNAHAFRQSVLFHDIASGRQSPGNIPLPQQDAADYTLITASREGRYLVAHHGLFAPKPVAIRDLAAKDAGWRPFITQAVGNIVGFVQDDRFVALTDIGAPRGRIVSIPLNAENPDDTECWTELLSESSRVLRSVKLVGGELYVTGFTNTYSWMGVLDCERRDIREIPLPASGAIVEPIFPLMNLIPRGHPDEYYFAFSSLTESWGVYCHRSGAKSIETVQAPAIKLQGAVVKDFWATSKDGTRVPYHVVSLANTESRLPAPALIYAYGAFNLPLLPEYPGAMAAFVAAGGVYVHAHIRGGAELGAEWWRGGRMQNKQNGYDDLYAIAEQLLANGLTTCDKLALTGRSNGGLMAAVAATQRPDLWRAIVAQVPVTDLVGILQDPYARYAVKSEFGDPDNPHDLMRMLQFSPYHLVRNGVAYPGIFIEAGATDPRCPPWHARKFAARMQSVESLSALPVLLRVRADAGHGPATAKAIQLEGYAEWLAFLMQQLGLLPPHSEY